jgi:hypothetical protein
MAEASTVQTLWELSWRASGWHWNRRAEADRAKGLRFRDLPDCQTRLLRDRLNLATVFRLRTEAVLRRHPSEDRPGGRFFQGLPRFLPNLRQPNLPPREM